MVASCSKAGRHGGGLEARQRFLTTASRTAVLAIFAPFAIGAAHAQDQSASAVETVTVSASRLVNAGFSAPTPTTVMSAQDLEQKAEVNLQTTLTQLPSMQAGNTTTGQNAGASTGNIGINNLNLRSLGTNRMLVLLDSERMVGAGLNGVVDISQLPQGLVRRIDIVSGGASASWGSDAVTGVANFVLDHNFNGIKGNIQGAISTYGDEQSSLIQLTAGTGFAGGHGHVEIAGEFSIDPGIHLLGGRTWYDATKVLGYSIAATPPGQPQFIVSPQAYVSQMAAGGVIVAGPLKGIAFGPGGKPYPFQYGSLVIDPLMIGGQSDGDTGPQLDLATGVNRANLYGRISYDFADGTGVYATVLYSAVYTNEDVLNELQKPGNLTIQCDNAFLDPSITAACTANKITNFKFGTINKDLGPIHSVNERIMRRFTLGANGSFNIFGKDFTWGAYGEHGANDVSNYDPGETLTPLYNLAIDAVRGANGLIVCRSAAAQARGCVPLNVMGTGVMSPQAIDWVEAGGIGPWKLTYQREEAASFSINGTPLTDWAGPVSIASGIEYREEAYRLPATDAYSVGDGGNPLLSSAGANWFQGNFQPGRGSYHVAEAFVEAGIPLMNDTSWGKADLDISGREEKYSTAGWVSTWKVGVTYDTPVSGLRLRALQSRDVRAPGLAELYTPVTVLLQNVIDDFPPNAGKSFAFHALTLGNTALKAERSSNMELGVVFQPDWFPGFNVSLDYWRIAIKGGITSLTAQNTVDLCFQGNAAMCANITRVGGLIDTVQLKPFNLSSTKVDGFDIETSYQTALEDLVPWISGNLTFRALATEVSSLVTNSGIPGAVTTHSVGARVSGAGNAPLDHWRLQIVEGYQNSLWGLNLTERFTSQGVINRQYIQCTTACPVPTINSPTINNNIIPSTLYLDIGGQFRLTDAGDVTAYFKIDNANNAPPTKNPSNSLFSADYSGDVIGRMYHVGVRFQE